MQITWDEPKRLANLDKHEMDFADLTLELFENATVYPARKSLESRHFAPSAGSATASSPP